MGNQEFESRATSIVRNWYNTHVPMAPTEIYVVWMVKVLRNNKAMISSNLSDGRYFEVTWDGERENFYLDVYSKVENQALDIGGIRMSTKVSTILAKAKLYLGVTTGSAKHKQIVDRYNGVKPLPVGYKVSYTDDWCDAFITALAIEAGAVDIIGRECGVQRHIDIFKAKGIWIEDGTITPRAGDIITFNWNDWSKANNGFADHIGIVESVKNGVITTIEGNTDRAVRRRTYNVGNGYIRGFARPKYAPETKPSTLGKKKSDDTIANEVIAGKWGTGTKRIQTLTSAGYNPTVIQNLVNAKLKGTATKKTNQQIATEIYRGLGGWGNGQARMNKLKAAGYDPIAVQKIVNRM